MKRFFKWLKSLFTGKKESITIPPTAPASPDSTPVPVPPVPAPIEWEKMNCKEIKAKIEEITQLLMTSKFIESIRRYWEEELAKGQAIYEKKCLTISNANDIA